MASEIPVHKERWDKAINTSPKCLDPVLPVLGVCAEHFLSFPHLLFTTWCDSGFFFFLFLCQTVSDTNAGILNVFIFGSQRPGPRFSY